MAPFVGFVHSADDSYVTHVAASVAEIRGYLTDLGLVSRGAEDVLRRRLERCDSGTCSANDFMTTLEGDFDEGPFEAMTSQAPQACHVIEYLRLSCQCQLGSYNSLLLPFFLFLFFFAFFLTFAGPPSSSTARSSPA